MAMLSGKFVLRISPEMHEDLKNRAFMANVSLNSLCQSLLVKGLRAESLSFHADRLHQMALKLLDRFESKLDAVVVFGSSVSGHMTEASDIDVLVVLNSSVSLSRRLYRDWDQSISDAQAPEITPHFCHHLKNPKEASVLWLEVMHNHKVLYDRSGRLAQTLQNLKDLQDQGEVWRDVSHGQPYWIWRAHAQS